MATANAVPEQSPSAPIRATKRRGSELSEQENDGKRQRLSPGKTLPQDGEEQDRAPAAANEEVDGNTAETAGATQEDQEHAPDSAQGVPQSETPTGEVVEDQSATGNTDHSRSPQSTTAVAPAGRKAAATRAVDEKQRTKRLFGALLGNLQAPAGGRGSGAASDRAARRRREIEDRRKAELQRQDERDAVDAQHKRERLAERRRWEGARFEEMSMTTRHRALRDRANFLQTRTEPRVYYRPWELTSDQKDQIEDQIRDAERQIDRELDELDARRRRNSDYERSAANSPPTRDKHKDSPHEDSSAPAIRDQTPEEPTTIETTDQGTASNENVEENNSADAQSLQPTDHPTGRNASGEEGDKSATGYDNEDDKGSDADDGDHVVEGDEDTVIY